MESKKKHSETQSSFWLQGVWAQTVEEMGKGCQRIQTSNYKIKTFRGSNVQHDGYSEKLIYLKYLKVAQRVDLKSFHCKKKSCNCGK